jgi:Carboxypeptidase regulatory-like domain
MIGATPAYQEYFSGMGMSVEPYRPDGTFELTDITPGYYWVTAQLPRTPLTEAQRQLSMTPGANLSELPRALRGSALVHVKDGDVENVELRIDEDLFLSGSVRVEGQPYDFVNEGRNVKLELRAVQVAGNGPPVDLPIKGDGGFVSRKVFPTEYRLRVVALPPTLYLKAAQFGRIDALTQSLFLTARPEDNLDIVLARGGEVRGVVTSEERKPMANQQVVLVPRGFSNRPDIYRTATTDAEGRFMIEGVVPGDYDAFAWKTIENFRYFDDTFVRRFEGKGTPVQVTETAPDDIWVPLIP